MDSIWKQLMELEMERRSESKGYPQLETLEILKEIVDSEKEGILSKSPEDRTRVPSEPPEKALGQGEEPKPSSILVANLANRIKKTMVEIRGLTESSQGRFKDPAFEQNFYRSMTEHIEDSETELNCFLDYLRINSPVQQTNTVHVILEEVLGKHKKKLMDKGIRIFGKQLEKSLPNARVHIEELRFILNWVLEYVIISTLPNQGIAFLTRSLEAQEANEAIRSPQQRGIRCLEIVMASGDYEDSNKQPGIPSKIRTARNEGERSWILPLVDEIVQKNRGLLKLSEGRLRMISLILPIERRKLIHYGQAVV